MKKHEPAAPPAAPKPLRAVMAEGPDQLSFCGIAWQRGVPQPVTPELWAAMQARDAERQGFQLLTEEN